MRVSLALVLMYAIGRDKTSGGRVIAFRVEECSVVCHVGKQRRAALHPVFFRNAEFGERGVIFGIDFAGAGESILQRER